MRLIKLHIGLFRYIKIELKKKRTPKQFVKFVKELIVAYIKELIKLYKDLFLILDADYQKQNQAYKKSQQIKVDLQRCLKMLQYVDEKMKQSKIPGYKRRQFWRDFYRDGQLRKDVFDDLLKEIDGLK
jgi:methionine salvage enolase-phosphatase E1